MLYVVDTLARIYSAPQGYNYKFYQLNIYEKNTFNFNRCRIDDSLRP